MSMAETIAQWLMKKYIEWITQEGSVQSQKAFADYLGIDRVVFNRYINGKRKDINYRNAMQIARRVGDYEILDILGYERPSDDDLLKDFPDELRESIVSALNDARSELVSKEITEGTSEAREIIITAFAKHGLSINVIEKESSKLSNVTPNNS